MEGEYIEEFSVCNVERDYPCICCSGAYDSFDSIDSVIEEKQKVKITEKIEDKVRKIKTTKGPATQEQIEERRKIKPVDKLKEQIAVIEERRRFQEQRFKEREGITAKNEKERIEKKFKAAEAAFLRNERSSSEKLMDAYLKNIEKQEEAELQQSCPIMIKSPCDLLKSGSATCSCTECRESRECRDDDGSVHSEDGLDLLTTTHV